MDFITIHDSINLVKFTINLVRCKVKIIINYLLIIMDSNFKLQIINLATRLITIKVYNLYLANKFEMTNTKE